MLDKFYYVLRELLRPTAMHYLYDLGEGDYVGDNEDVTNKTLLCTSRRMSQMEDFAEGKGDFKRGLVYSFIGQNDRSMQIGYTVLWRHYWEPEEKEIRNETFWHISLGKNQMRDLKSNLHLLDNIILESRHIRLLKRFSMSIPEIILKYGVSGTIRDYA